VENIGSKLRAVRERLKLSRQDVEEETNRIAQLRGNPSCKISANWLYRVESGDHGIGGIKLLTLAYAYQLTVEELLALDDAPDQPAEADWHLPVEPRQTLLLTPGPLDDLARLRLPDGYSSPPKRTKLLQEESTSRVTRYVRAIVGKEDNRMYPLLHPGAIVLIDRHSRAVAKHPNVKNEFEIPIYFFETHDGPVFGWTSLGKNDILSILAHPCSGKSPLHFQYKHEIDVIGQIVGVQMWITPPIPKANGAAL
jgi:transcriptional regulator with XRE-family HTH domain